MTKTDTAIIDFGRHYGLKVSNLPTSYLVWLSRNGAYKAWHNVAKRILFERRCTEIMDAARSAPQKEHRKEYRADEAQAKLITLVDYPKQQNPEPTTSRQTEAEPEKMTFGKYEGVPINCVPEKYLKWLTRPIAWLDIRDAAKRELKERAERAERRANGTLHVKMAERGGARNVGGF